VIRAHAGRRHARPTRDAPRKTFRAILRDALITAIGWALIGGVGYWATLQWFDVANDSAWIPNDTLIISTGPGSTP
jgi:hypothetical protein